MENLENLVGESVTRERGGVEGVRQEAECPICYCLHYQGLLPDQPCEHCCTPFHAACLYDVCVCVCVCVCIYLVV